MEKSVTCDPGISSVFHVSLPWEVLKVSVFSLVCIKPEFLVRKKNVVVGKVQRVTALFTV